MRRLEACAWVDRRYLRALPDQAIDAVGNPLVFYSLVVLEFNSHLLSGPFVPIHFFRALFLKQLISRLVLLDLVIRHYRLRGLDRR
jgi:hypothetical protein